MTLDNVGVVGLSEDFKKVIVSNEVESRELLAFLLQVVVECLLAHLELGQDRLEALLQTWNLAKTHHLGVSAEAESNRSVLFVDTTEPTLL